jgi:hypothetical protein
LCFACFALRLVAPNALLIPENRALQTDGNAESAFYADTHPYLEKTPEELIRYIPELRTVRPAQDQHTLSMILENTGRRVDDFLRDIVDLIAHEDIRQEIVSRRGDVLASRHLQCNYLIVLHRDENPIRFEEYREDTKRGALALDAANGFSMTTGFALHCIRFSTSNLTGSAFRYLGDERIGGRETYVVAFGQKPEDTKNLQSVSGNWGSAVVRLQGIAWIDQDTFQILRLRTDLLAPPTNLGFAQETTIETFSEIKLPDTPAPLWLPTEVTVNSLFRGQAFRNEHHYSKYERFRVTVRIKEP